MLLLFWCLFGLFVSHALSPLSSCAPLHFFFSPLGLFASLYSLCSHVSLSSSALRVCMCVSLSASQMRKNREESRGDGKGSVFGQRTHTRGTPDVEYARVTPFYASPSSSPSMAFTVKSSKMEKGRGWRGCWSDNSERSVSGWTLLFLFLTFLYLFLLFFLGGGFFSPYVCACLRVCVFLPSFCFVFPSPFRFLLSACCGLLVVSLVRYLSLSLSFLRCGGSVLRSLPSLLPAFIFLRPCFFFVFVLLSHSLLCRFTHPSSLLRLVSLLLSLSHSFSLVFCVLSCCR